MTVWNRKLLVSAFDAQEAREAILGGGRIVDSENPKSALGNIKPRDLGRIRDAVLEFKRDLGLHLSTNIGEDQLLFRRSESGHAIAKSPYEMAGKAAQAAVGVAYSMGTRVHPVNVVKVGVDGMPAALVREVLAEVVGTLAQTEHCAQSHVMAVFFAQDLGAWHERKKIASVRRVLVGAGDFSPCDPGHGDAFDLREYAGALRDRYGKNVVSDGASLQVLVEHGFLPQDSRHTFVRASELFPHSECFPDAKFCGKTSIDVLRAMIDAVADAGAHGIMIDTSILSKVTRICLVDTASTGMVDLNKYDVRDGLPNRGIVGLDELRFFVDYGHHRGLVVNVCGSLTSYQAQQLWVLLPELDQVATRGEASAVARDASGQTADRADTRQHRTIKRHLVRGMAPPEHGGVLNLPARMKTEPGAMEAIQRVRVLIRERRRTLGLPNLRSYFVDCDGNAEEIHDERGAQVSAPAPS